MPVTHSQIDRIIDVAKIYGATRLILFGSAVDMPENARDIDIACDGVDGRFTKYIESKGKILL